MVHNDVMRAASGTNAIDFPTALLGSAGLAGPNAEVLDNGIMSNNVQAAADEGDTRSGSCLASNGDEGLLDTQAMAAEINDAADFKNDEAGTRGNQRLGQ